MITEWSANLWMLAQRTARYQPFTFQMHWYTWLRGAGWR